MKYKPKKYLSEVIPEYRKYLRNVNNLNSAEEANNYIFYNVFKANNNDNVVLKINKYKTLTFSRDNYLKAFNFNNYSLFKLKDRIKLFYWYFLDECKNLNIQNIPNFIFCKDFGDDIDGCYINELNNLYVNLDFKGKELSDLSAYCILDTISHELNHAKYYENEEEFSGLKTKNYFSYIEVEDYNIFNEKDLFYSLLDSCLHRFQPIELYAYNYGTERSLQVFEENYKNVKLKNINLADLRYFRQIKKNFKDEEFLLKKVFGVDSFKTYLKRRDNLQSILINLETKKVLIKSLNRTARFKKAEVTISESLADNKELQRSIKEYSKLVEKYYYLKSLIVKQENRLFLKYKKVLKETKINITENFYEFK